MKAKNYFTLFLLSLALFSFAGCAMNTIQPISAKKLNSQWHSGTANAGYVFYQPELYFLVTPGSPQKGSTNNVVADKNSVLDVTPIYLPNPKKPYRVTTFNFLAKSDFAFNFKDGWELSSIADKADNTTVANTVAGELKTILNASGFSAMMASPSSSEEKKSFLLHPIYNPKSGIITGFSVIKLPLALQ